MSTPARPSETHSELEFVGLRASIDGLRSVAAATISAHAAESGQCVVCGCLWPCPDAALAENHLAVL